MERHLGFHDGSSNGSIEGSGHRLCDIRQVRIVPYSAIRTMRGEPLPVTSVLTAFQGFEYRDGSFGVDLPGKLGAASNH